MLDDFESVKICTAYELDGEITDKFPGGVAALERCRPVLEEMPGWSTPTASITEDSSLPKEAKNYVEKLQEVIGCPIDVISTGPHRNETIKVRPLIGLP